MVGTVLSVSSRAMLDACARLGLDTDQILYAAGLDRATLEDPDARIPVEQVDALWRKAYELSGDPNLALHAIEVLPFGAYRVIDYLASSAPTIGTALAKVSNYFPLIRNGVVRLPYVVGDTQVTFAIEDRRVLRRSRGRTRSTRWLLFFCGRGLARTCATRWRALNSVTRAR